MLLCRVVMPFCT
uniref:Uncharacterized protein n=1 Tax=Rhizophora mucronata TaxID=61149 RepID=A0A2P2LH49_RHIMU